MPPEQDQAMAICSMHKKFGEDRTGSLEQMIADKYTQRDMLITILRSPIRGTTQNIL